MDDTMYDVGSIRSGSASARFRQGTASYTAPTVPKKSWKKRIMDSLRAFVAFVFSKVGICVLVIGTVHVLILLKRFSKQGFSLIGISLILRAGHSQFKIV